MKTIRTYINLAEAGFASSLLEAAGISTLLKGEESFLMTPGPATGGIQLQVREEDAEKALRVLEKGFDATMEESAAGEAKAEPMAGVNEAQCAAGEGRIPAGLFVALAAVLALFAFAVYQWNANLRADRAAQAKDRYEIDDDHDGRPDHFFIYRNGVHVRTEADRNGDGRVDEWVAYDREGRIEHVELDENFDGRPDAWTVYGNGKIQSGKLDSDFDGKPDWFLVYENGIVVRSDCRPGDSAVVFRRHLFVDGVLREEQVDEDRDGKFDYKILYDAFGTPSERLPFEAAK